MCLSGYFYFDKFFYERYVILTSFYKIIICTKPILLITDGNGEKVGPGGSISAWLYCTLQVVQYLNGFSLLYSYKNIQLNHCIVSWSLHLIQNIYELNIIDSMVKNYVTFLNLPKLCLFTFLSWTFSTVANRVPRLVLEHFLFSNLLRRITYNFPTINS